MPTKDTTMKATAILGMQENMFNSMSKYLKLPVKQDCLFIQKHIMLVKIILRQRNYFYLLKKNWGQSCYNINYY